MFNGFSSGFQFGRRPAPVVVPANPAIIPNNVVWYNSDLGTNVNFNNNITTGTRVNQWTDRSGAAHSSNGSGAGRPTWISPFLNNYGVLQFNGTGNVMTVNPVTWMQSLSGYSLFMVARASSLATLQYLSATDTGGFAIFHNGTNWGVATSGGTGISTVTGDTTNFRIFGLIYDGTQTTNADRLKFRYAGTNRSLSFTGTVGSTTSATAKYWNIGASSSVINVVGDQNFYNGYMCEVMMWTRALSNSEILGVEQYLKNHWLIT